ncbi:hypothetical protein JXA63_04015 [Candidatus Woesebacteria bacterium]|nr:hypothetical protein [Candidatus Woesebacteria bacterium]
MSIIADGEIAALDISGGSREVNRTFSGIRHIVNKEGIEIHSKRIKTGEGEDGDRYTLYLSSRKFEE